MSFRSRQLGYDLTENLLFRPALLLVAFVAAGLLFPEIDRRWPLGLPSLFPPEPSTAQVVLGTIAGATMTVVSVVYSILLVALSLASVQFSTRILAGFVRDRVSQNTLGLFVGTFVYSLMVVRTVRTDPIFVPGFSILGALLLSLGSLAALVFFIHHIIRSIQANHLVDRIAGETEGVLDAVFVDRLGVGEEPAPPSGASPPPGAAPVFARRSGYIQLLDLDSLRRRVSDGVELHLARGMGQFVAAGTPVAWVLPPAAATDALAATVDRALDLGPHRTMQDDAEFGFRQIVDIALKAVSPAVNDPSTACTVVDHLGRLLVRVAGRPTPPGRFTEGRGLLVVPGTSFVDLVELAVDQLRQYTRTDMAVTLRLLRMLADLALATPHRTGRAAILRQVELIEGGLGHFQPAECEELRRRVSAARQACGAVG